MIQPQVLMDKSNWRWAVCLKMIGLGSMVVAALSALPGSAIAEMQPTWYNCLTREVFTPAKKAWCDRWRVLQNATYIVPANLGPNAEWINVTLSNGRYQRQDQTFLVELVNEKNWMTFGDLNNDGKTDAAVIFGVALDPTGKAIATYLTAVMDIDGKARALTPVKLGERIRLNGPIAIANESITVPFLTATQVINREYVIQEGLQPRK